LFATGVKVTLPKPLPISGALIADLVNRTKDLSLRTTGGVLGRLEEEALRDIARSCLGDAFFNELKLALGTPAHGEPGYVRIRFDKALLQYSDDDLVSILTAVCAGSARPVHVFDRWPLWKPLGVSFDIDPRRATGVGFNPLHMDVVNAEMPPDYVAFFCRRADPAGGGHSVIANMRRAFARISSEARRALREAQFVEGAFYGLSGVGAELRPFPFLDAGASVPRLRFTAKMLPELEEGAESDALREFNDAMLEDMDIFLLDEADLMLVNQWECAHGRLPLGEGQRAIAEDERRLVYQCFFMQTDGSSASNEASAIPETATES
jgi:hypothetical protein